MPRPQRVTDEEILRVLRAAILEHGPRVSLDVVAQRLGVTTPALFRRFGSRNDLIAAALRPDDEPPFLDHIHRGPDERPAEPQLAELFTLIGGYLVGMLPCVSALRESGIPYPASIEIDEPPPLRMVRALAGWLTRARAAGLVAVDDVEATATAMVGAVQAPVFLRYLMKRSDPWDAPRYARRLAHLFVSGLATSVKTSRVAAPAPRTTAASTRRRKRRHKEP